MHRHRVRGKVQGEAEGQAQQIADADRCQLPAKRRFCAGGFLKWLRPFSCHFIQVSAYMCVYTILKADIDTLVLTLIEVPQVSI